jgi:hypothetical protein
VVPIAWSLRRHRRDKPVVAMVGAFLLVCTVFVFVFVVG